MLISFMCLLPSFPTCNGLWVHGSYALVQNDEILGALSVNAKKKKVYLLKANKNNKYIKNTAMLSLILALSFMMTLWFVRMWKSVTGLRGRGCPSYSQIKKTGVWRQHISVEMRTSSSAENVTWSTQLCTKTQFFTSAGPNCIFPFR